MLFYYRGRSLQEEELELASIATEEPFTPSPLSPSCCSMLGPMSSTGAVPAHRGCSYANGTDAVRRHTPPVTSPVSDHVQSSWSPSLPASNTDSAPVPVQRARSLEGVLPGTPQMTAVLPRGFRRSEGTSRLSTGVTPKPFSAKTSRRSTQPRFYFVSAFSALPMFIYSFQVFNYLFICFCFSELVGLF